MRWFALDNGVLSYYKSQEEVNQGCKGSLKVSACEIIGNFCFILTIKYLFDFRVKCQLVILKWTLLKCKYIFLLVHPSDHTRLEIAIPGEQHMYLKASSKQERQQWLVALGSSKACMTTKSRKDMDLSYGDSIKTKKFELKLYCDLLMQQVHQLKTFANDENGINVTKLNEAASLLTATCDTFISTLDECMKLGDANFLFELSHHHPTDVMLPQSYHQKVKTTVPVMKRSCSYESNDIKSLEKKTWGLLKSKSFLK